MIKRIVATALLVTLFGIVVVQAMEKVNPQESEAALETGTIPVEKIPGIGLGNKAPDFELKTLEGESIKLSDLEGEKIMLNFWATWCPPCKKEMPDMQQFYEEAKEDITILAVNIDPENDVARFADDMKLKFPILLDEKEKVMNTYKILSIPTTFFIDEKGVIQNKFLGAMTIEQMRKYSKNLGTS